MHNKDFQLAQTMARCLGAMELSLFQDRDEAIMFLREDLPPGVPRTDIDEKLNDSLDGIQPGCVYEINAVYEIYYILIYNGDTQQYLLAGPCLLGKFDEGALRARFSDTEVSQRFHETIRDLCGRCPQITYSAFYQLGTALGQWLMDSEENLPHQRMGQNWRESYNAYFMTDQYVEFAQMQAVERRHEINAAMIEAVKCGNLSMAYSFMDRFQWDTDAPAYHSDPVRNLKIICVSLNTQLRQAVEELGVHSFMLDRMFRDINTRIEEMWRKEEVDRYAEEIVRLYCEIAREEAFRNLRPFAHLAVAYIKDHLSENITVRETAKVLLVNPDYLSSCFHKEVGMTFIDFVNRERTAQAAGLLRNTSLQIQEIASVVGYNNTSYFAKQFTRFYGTSPRDYRARGGIRPQPPRG